MTSTDVNNVLIVIGGPTGIGKTDIAIELAKLFSCDIFSADSRQLYKEMTIGTAKPSAKELKEIRHHFIDHVSIKDNYNAGKYEKEVINALNDYYAEHRLAVMAGGTGLYIKAVTDGLDEFPDVSKEIIEELKELLQNEGISSLQKLLKEADPAYYEMVDLNNPQRLHRALSVIRQTGKPYSSFLNQVTQVRNFKPIFILLEMDRKKLYQRINLRVDQMMEKGLLAEVKAVRAHKDLNSLQTVGYKELIDYLDGKFSYEEAIDKIKQNSRRYAKRQLTWFRKDPRWTPFKVEDRALIIKYIRKETGIEATG